MTGTSERIALLFAGGRINPHAVEMLDSYIRDNLTRTFVPEKTH